MEELSCAGRDYLEAMLLLENSQEKVHSVDLARAMGVTRASVCRAVGSLCESGFLAMEGRLLHLTEKGKAAAMANKELGTIPADVADALIWACDQLIAGKYNDQFVTDWLQGGAGTSTNMNCNEVISNLACEHLGLAKGDKKVSPNDHANFGQSTNDTYPTALHLSLLLRSNVLLKAVEELVGSF